MISTKKLWPVPGIFTVFFILIGATVMPPESDFGFILTAQPAPTNNTTPNAANTAATASSARSDVELDGFADTDWGMEFDAVHKKLYNLATAAEEAATNDDDEEEPNMVERTEIVNIVRNRLILVRRNRVLYRYTFHKTPYVLAQIEKPELKAATYDSEVPGKLFHVQLQMQWLDAAIVQKKLAQRYGRSNASKLKVDGSGAYMWQLDGGNIYQWVEHYKGRNYTRRIDYVSTQFQQKIQREFLDYLQADEKAIAQGLRLD